MLRHKLAIQHGDQGAAKRLIARVTDNKQGALGYRPIEAGRKIVEPPDALSSIEERVNHVASDISGAAGNQDRHAGSPVHIAKLWRRSPIAIRRTLWEI